MVFSLLHHCVLRADHFLTAALFVCEAIFVVATLLLPLAYNPPESRRRRRADADVANDTAAVTRSIFAIPITIISAASLLRHRLAPLTHVHAIASPALVDFHLRG